jgi:hypothetical protein
MTIDGKQLKAGSVAVASLASGAQTTLNRLISVVTSTGFSDPGSTSFFDVPGFSVAIPRAGTYFFYFVATLQCGTNPTFVGIGMAYTGTTTTLICHSESPSSGSGIAFYVPQTTAGSPNTSSVGTTNSRSCRCSGHIVVSTTGTLKVQMSRTANTISSTGGTGIVVEQ